jgi:hypothetical protein
MAVEEGDFFKIRREQFDKQRKVAKKRNETFLKVSNIVQFSCVNIFVF